MSDERRASLATLARLRREIADDRVAMAARAAEAHEVVAMWGDAPPPRPHLVVAAAALHAWYTGLEAVLERIARTIDSEVPRGAGSHRELLSQAMVAVDGLRPAVLPRSLQRDLTALLAFRHFFRHAYGVELDPQRLLVELRRLAAVEGPVGGALSDFDRFLARTAESLGDS